MNIYIKCLLFDLTYQSASNVSNEKFLKVWTDGSSINNGQHGAKAGIGVYWGKDDPR